MASNVLLGFLLAVSAAFGSLAAFSRIRSKRKRPA
jgi:hypothetical protein